MVITMNSLVWLLIIGAIAGFLAGKLTRGGGFGLIGDIIVGIAGAFVGNWAFGAFGLVAYGLIGQIVVSTIGAVLFLTLIRILKSA